MSHADPPGLIATVVACEVEVTAGIDGEVLEVRELRSLPGERGPDAETRQSERADRAARDNAEHAIGKFLRLPIETVAGAPHRLGPSRPRALWTRSWS